MRNLFVIVACLFVLALSPAWAQSERILDYHSDIEVSANGEMRVRETIRVIAAGDQIKRGIYRDFPTDYEDRLGNKYKVGFDVISATRDGSPEEFRSERRDNGVRVYLGNKNTYVEPGEHTYTIGYTTNRQLGYFKDHDELYWNVTGNGWVFPIETASATVTLPSGIQRSEIRPEGYTGPQGSKARDLQSRVNPDGTVDFQTTRVLGEHEGLTIVASFPKGYVAEPRASDKAGYFLKDNAQALVGLIGLAVVLGYYLFVWFAVGKDPERGTIMVTYEPPAGLSPAGLRYLMRMGFDQKTFASAVLDMAVRGYLTITDDDGTYVLQRTKANETVLLPDERVIAAKLFDDRDHIRLDNKYRMQLSGAMKDLGKSLSKTEEKIYFVTNRGSFLFGLAISLIVALLLYGTAEGQYKFVGGFMTVWLTGWTFGVYALISQIVTLWKAPAQNGLPAAATKAGAGGMMIFAIPFVAGEIFGLTMFAKAVSVPGALAIAGLAGMAVLFHHLLKAPTRLGRKMMDQVEGFKMFLSAVEGDRLNRMNPPDKTPALFEKYLPYALALDVEQAWADQFASVLAQAARESGGTYSPVWFTGGTLAGLAAGDFASSFAGSFSSAIAASASAPGSSSGSGGGGSSGGGGGGGGGGGW